MPLHHQQASYSGVWAKTAEKTASPYSGKVILYLTWVSRNEFEWQLFPEGPMGFKSFKPPRSSHRQGPGVLRAT